MKRPAPFMRTSTPLVRASVRIAVLCVMPLLLGDIAMAQRTDRIIPVGQGSPISGTVKRTTPNSVIIDVRGKEQEVDAREIGELILAGAPNSLRRAQESIAQGQYESAIVDLTGINMDELDRDLVKQEVEFWLAYARAKDGSDLARAGRDMTGFLRGSAQSHHYYTALEVLGDLLTQTGRYANAADLFARLGRAPWPDVKVRAAVLEAQALQAQGPEKFAEAIQKYDAVIDAQVSGEEAARQQLLARVGKAACAASVGDPQSAIKDLQKLIRENDPTNIELYAKAYNALGACFEKLGQSKEARHAYLHTDVVFYQARDAHAEALYHLARLWNDAGQADRAAAARNMLKSRYAETVWAKE